MLLDDPGAADADYSSVRLIIYAGASIGLNLLRRALTEIGCDFLNFYGATETSAGVTFLLPDDHRLDDAARLKSCGRPLPLIDIKIADPDGNELPSWTGGRIPDQVAIVDHGATSTNRRRRLPRSATAGITRATAATGTTKGCSTSSTGSRT